MKVAFGLKAHSGWAALVVLGTASGDLQVVDRRRIDLVEEEEASWGKQPYHAAVRLSPDDALDVVERGIQSARRAAIREMRAAVRRARDAGHEVSACAIVTSDSMPEWSVAEILAVHFRMHKAEGVLFREALGRAAGACRLRLVEIPERLLEEQAEQILATPVDNLWKRITILGKSVGPPWGKDQKEASLAALTALQGRLRHGP